MIRKYHNHTLQTNPWHSEDKIHKTPGRQLSKATSSLFTQLSKVTSSLFPIKMITKLERTHSNLQLNMEQIQNSTMGTTINNEPTTIEPPL